MNEARPPGRLGSWVAGLLALNAVAELLDLGISMLYAGSVAEAQELERAGLDPLSGDLLVVEPIAQFIAIGGLMLLLVTAVVYLVWFQRMYVNLAFFGMPGNHSPGWAIGAWFVPILSLFRPLQMMREVWEKSGPQEGDFSPAPASFGIWWGLWILSNVVDRVSGTFFENATSLDKLYTAILLGMGAAVINGAAAFYALRVVQAVNARQTEAIASRAGTSAAAPQTF